MSKKKKSEAFGVVYDSVADMCRAFRVGRDTFNSRLRKGWDIEEALTTPARSIKISDSHSVEFRGVKYTSKKHLAEAYGLNANYLYNLLNKGFSLEDAVSGMFDVHKKNQSVVINGERYDNLVQALADYGVSMPTFKKRVARGLSFEDAITKRKISEDLIIDGVEYDSVASLCKHFGISPPTLYNRISKGMTLKEAVTTPKNHIGANKIPVTVEGIVYDNIADAAKFYSVSLSYIYKKKKEGLGLEDILINASEDKEKSKRNRGGSTPVIFEGVTYKSITEASRVTGFSPYMVKKLTSGGTVSKKKGIATRTPNDSLKILCAELGITRKRLNFYLKKGLSVEVSLVACLDELKYKNKRHSSDK